MSTYTKPPVAVAADRYDAAVHCLLRYHPETATGRWEPSTLQPGHVLNQPGPLFKKLEPKIIEEERARLGKPA